MSLKGFHFPFVLVWLLFDVVELVVKLLFEVKGCFFPVGPCWSQVWVVTRGYRLLLLLVNNLNDFIWDVLSRYRLRENTFNGDMALRLDIRSVFGKLCFGCGSWYGLSRDLVEKRSVIWIFRGNIQSIYLTQVPCLVFYRLLKIDLWLVFDWSVWCSAWESTSQLIGWVETRHVGLPVSFFSIELVKGLFVLFQDVFDILSCGETPLMDWLYLLLIRLAQSRRWVDPINMIVPLNKSKPWLGLLLNFGGILDGYNFYLLIHLIIWALKLSLV